MQSNRSPDDELMLKMIGNPNSNTKGKHEKKINCKIYDARGYLAALGNRFQGKGYENI